jgi:hypothetical protein
MNAIFKSKHLLALAVSFATFSTAEFAFAQKIVVDFRFDGQSGAAATTQTLLPGSAGQSYTIDVFATVVGDAAHADPSVYGLKNIKYRGFSDVVAGGGAFATGAGIGYTGSFAGVGAFTGSNTTAPKSADTGSTTDGGSVTLTADGIIDFGQNTLLSNASQSIPNFTPTGATGVEIAQFVFHTGQVTTTAGARTQFSPVIPNTTSASNYTQDGSTPIIGGITIGSPLTFTVAPAAGTTISVTPATATASVLKGGAISLSKTVNNTGSTALAAGDYTFAASGGTAISYTAMPSVPIPAPGSANFSTTAATTPGPGGTPIGLATVTFTATATGSAITNSPQSATTTLNVGGAIADNTNTAGIYGPPISAVVGPSGSYAGLESAVVGLQGTGGSNAAVTPFAPPWLGGDAKILAGSSSSGTARTVSMAWRTRLVGIPTGGQLSETHGGAGSALQATKSTTGLVSDVVNLTGLETGTPNAGSTDPFVLDMTYNPGLLPKGGSPAIEQNLANNKQIYMVSPTPGPDDGVSQYVNTVALNTGNVIVNPLDIRYGYKGSYAQFQADPLGGNGGTPGSELGAWGVDIATHEVWSVVDHNSTFAVVPEPATILLAGLGLLGLFGLRRAKKNAA